MHRRTATITWTDDRLGWRTARSPIALLGALALAAPACAGEEQPAPTAAPAVEEPGAGSEDGIDAGLEEHVHLLEHAAEDATS